MQHNHKVTLTCMFTVWSIGPTKVYTYYYVIRHTVRDKSTYQLITFIKMAT